MSKMPPPKAAPKGKDNGDTAAGKKAGYQAAAKQEDNAQKGGPPMAKKGAPVDNPQTLGELLAAMGRNGDTMLAHINPQEFQMLAAATDGPSRNPKTGLPEFYDENGNPGGFGGNLSSGASGAQAMGSGVTGAGSWGSGYSGTAGNMNLSNPQGYNGGYSPGYGYGSALNAFRGGANPGGSQGAAPSWAVKKNVTVKPASSQDYYSPGTGIDWGGISAGIARANGALGSIDFSNPNTYASGGGRPGSGISPTSPWGGVDFNYNPNWTGKWASGIPAEMDVYGSIPQPTFNPNFSFLGQYPSSGINFDGMNWPGDSRPDYQTYKGSNNFSNFGGGYNYSSGSQRGPR